MSQEDAKEEEGDIERVFDEANALLSELGNDGGQFCQKLRDQLKRLGDEEVNIAVTGNTGVGKSSFINAVLG